MSRMILSLILLNFAVLFYPNMAYQIQIPNYQILRSQKLLTRNFRLNYQNQFLGEGYNKQKNGDFEPLNQGKKFTIIFEMFIYPYRVYSYFDSANKKQFILKKVGFEQFRNIQNPQNQKQQLKTPEQESIIENQFNVKDCLFQGQSLNSQGNNPSQPQGRRCLKQRHLYSLLPQLLTIVQQEHQLLEVQKINQEYILIKNRADKNSNRQLKYNLNLDIYRLNIHSYVYQARLTFMRYLFQQKSLEKRSPEHKEAHKIQKDRAQVPNQTLSQNKSDSFFLILVKQFFNNQYQIWNTLIQKNQPILTNLFNFQNTVSIQQATLFDYIGSSNSFYVVQINQESCPLQTNQKKSTFFASFEQQIQKYSDQKLSIQSLCTYTTIHKTPYVQFQPPEPIRHISKESFFKNVKLIALGLVQVQDQGQFNRKNDLLIHIVTEQMNIDLWYGDAWKKIIAQPRIKQVYQNKNQFPAQVPVQKVFFLKNLAKVQVKDDKVKIYKRANSGSQRFVQTCQVNIQAQLLTAQKINNKFIVVCVQGSNCMIIDEQCQVVQRMQFPNAFGIAWKYKIDHINNNILSYVSASKFSEGIYQFVSVALDQTKITRSKGDTGHFHRKFQIYQSQPYLYNIKQEILSPTLSLRNDKDLLQIVPQFRASVLPYEFQPLKLLPDQTYAQFLGFKQAFLDYVLQDYIQEKFTQFYFPKFGLDEQKQIKILNYRDHSDFQQFFSGCSYDQDKSTIHFQQKWNACKVILKTNSLLFVDPFQTARHEQQENLQLKMHKDEKITGPLQTNQKSRRLVQNKNDDQDSQTNKKEIVQIFTKQNISPHLNQMVVCSTHRNAPPYSKCRVSQYQITENFFEGQRKVKFFLQGTRYFQLYFFNRKFITQSKTQSFLQLLEKLARQNMANESKKWSKNQKKSQLKQVRIIYQKQNKSKQSKQHFDIFLRDYEKEQMQSISKILLISYCIFFPSLAMCCCVICFKTYFQNILVYYGVIRVEPSFRYPLNKLALKIKMKELQKNGYLNILKNKRVLKITEQNDSNSDIKFSMQCCFCLQQLKNFQQVVQLYCKHEFHSQCFLQWVKNQPNTKCPICKRAFTKSALNQFKQKRSNSIPKKPLQFFSDENQNQPQQLQESNQIEMLQFQS